MVIFGTNEAKWFSLFNGISTRYGLLLYHRDE